MIAIYLISIIIGVIGIGVYIGFTTSEGKDERGKAILAGAAQVAFVFVFLGFAFHLLFIEFAKPMVEQVRATMTAWMALVFISNGISILFFRRKMWIKVTGKLGWYIRKYTWDLASLTNLSKNPLQIAKGN